MDATLNICLRLSLSDNCVEFKPNDASCSKLKRYMAACPETKPVRSKIDVQVSSSAKIKKTDKSTDAPEENEGKKGATTKKQSSGEDEDHETETTKKSGGKNGQGMRHVQGFDMT